MSDKRLAYLDAMGVQLWVPRGRSLAACHRDTGASLHGGSAADTHIVVPPPLIEEEPLRGGAPLAANQGNNPPPASVVLTAPDAALLDWDALRARVASCTACGLHQGRTQTVFGVGNQHAQWMIVGEAPGADEDRQGEPFVGRAGKLLNAMLLAIGLKREEVYIANVVKCRPPNNRDPAPEEAAACEPYLRRQIALIQPKVILVVGRIAAHNLLKTEDSLGTLRGRHFTYADTNIPVVVTYHPAYLLRSPREKRKAWEDLQFARRIAAQTSGD